MKRTEIKHLLPGVFQNTISEGTPLAAILEVMEALHAPSEEQLRTLDANFDAYRVRDTLVPFLARWVDLDRLFEKPLQQAGTQNTAARLIPTGLGRLRELIAAAAYLSQWRGTAKGLVLFLETATGADGFEIEEHILDRNGNPRPFHFRVRVPEGLENQRVLIQRIIESERPAYVTYEIDYKGTSNG
jgi:phage tail-like protein